MAQQDEKKPPVGGFDVIESWEVQLYANGRAGLYRRGPSGNLIECYRSTTREHAAQDFVAIMQGCEPLRHFTPAAGSGHNTSAVFGERRDVPAHPAGHQCLLDAQPAECRVRPAARASQVNRPARIAPQPLRVVLAESFKPALVVLHGRLNLLKLRAQINVLALQRPDPLSQKGQMLAQYRRTAALVDQRLQLVEQHIKHFIQSRGLSAGHGTGEVV